MIACIFLIGLLNWLNKLLKYKFNNKMLLNLTEQLIYDRMSGT